MIVVLIELICKGATLSVFDLLQLDVSSVINLKYMFSFFSDSLQFAEMVLICSEW